MQQPIELILLKQWAGHLAIPIWLMGESGDLLFYNEPAEKLLGVRFDEFGEIHADQMEAHFSVTRLDGSPYPNEEIPVVWALAKREPRYDLLRFRSAGGDWVDVAVTAFPITGEGGRHLGAVAMFWEPGKP